MHLKCFMWYINSSFASRSTRGSWDLHYISYHNHLLELLLRISSFFTSKIDTSYNQIHTQSFAKKEIEEEEKVKAPAWGINGGSCLEHVNTSRSPCPLVCRYQWLSDVVDNAVLSTRSLSSLVNEKPLELAYQWWPIIDYFHNPQVGYFSKQLSGNQVINIKKLKC